MVTRDRKELPPYAKMPYEFDIDRIKSELVDMPTEVRDYISLTCDANSAYSSYDKNTYHLIPITDFDEENVKEFATYKKAGRKDMRFDERRYTKILDWARNSYIEEVLGTFKGQVTRSHVRRMNPGGYLKFHMDYNTKYSVRYHIPLTTNDDCVFKFKLELDGEEECMHMPADGSCYFFNQGYYHQAENNGKTDRDHLVLAVHGQEDIQHL
tara:strand:+ start:270 stop:902 length:633 start_codon:yes stop_codon:yes gene_type:complete